MGFVFGFMAIVCLVVLVGILVTMEKEEERWWYIAYYCVNHASHYGVTAEKCISPAEWSIKASMEYDDGPYIIQYAQPITEEQAKTVKGYLA